MTDDRPAMSSAPSSGPTSTAPIDAAAVEKALTPFRVMAFAVGVGLLLLVLEMILKYIFSNPVLAWWQIPHGFLYMVYLAATANLGFAARWSLQKMVLTMLAGVVPFLSFWVEHRRTQEVRDLLRGSSPTQ